VSKLIKAKVVRINGIEEIEKEENLLDGSNKYGLTDVSDTEFLRQGFVMDDVYYLYNIFLDGSVAEVADTMPLTLRLFCDEICDSALYMRCDKNLAVPKNHLFSTATMDMQLFRGISLNFDNLEKTIRSKEIIVHFNPETFHKVILVISKNSRDDGDMQYQLSVEELWNPEKVRDEMIITNFVHGIYSTNRRKFLHIDFSVNQYAIEIYKSKFHDSMNQTGIPIDMYADKHYKVWCIEGKINIDTWGKLVIATLDEPFRDLFAECFNGTLC